MDRPAKFEARRAFEKSWVWEVWDVTHPAYCNHFPVVTVDSKGASEDLHERYTHACAAALTSQANTLAEVGKAA